MMMKFSQLLIQWCPDLVHKVIPVVTNLESELKIICKLWLHRLKDEIDRTSAGKRYTVRECARAYVYLGVGELACACVRASVCVYVCECVCVTLCVCVWVLCMCV